MVRSLPGCGQVPGDVAHLLSGECLALQPYLATTLHHLSDMLHLLHPVLSALHGDRETTPTIQGLPCLGMVCPQNKDEVVRSGIPYVKSDERLIPKTIIFYFMYHYFCCCMILFFPTHCVPS